VEDQQIIEPTSPTTGWASPRPGPVPMLDAASWAAHKPDRHLVLTRAGSCHARCSLWTTNTPSLHGQAVGVIGHYASADTQAGEALLRHACVAIAQTGLKTIVGPMDGNTWRRYRLLTDRGTEPPFFLEPDNPDDWPAHFSAAGFTPLARYISSLNENLSVRDPRIPGAMERAEKDGVRFRNIHVERYEDELKAIHDLSIESFAGNFLYTPVTQDEFLAMYAPLRQMIRPELVLLAEREDRLVGFMFGVPDLLEIRRGEKSRTVIAKTLAVRPGRSGAGLGSILLDQFQLSAHRLGYERVIHALMHQDNRSVKISAHTGRPMREYTLYSKAVL
jgi:L-amino acid N-acyltransferase YncA